MKWLMIGALCAVYRLLLEERLMAWMQELRDVLHLVRQRQARAGPPPAAKTPLQLFSAGFLAALIVFFWPVYLIFAVGKLLGFMVSTWKEVSSR